MENTQNNSNETTGLSVPLKQQSSGTNFVIPDEPIPDNNAKNNGKNDVKNPSEKNSFTEFLRFFRDFFIILLIVIFIRGFIVSPFNIKGYSMFPSYFDREYIIVDRLSYLQFSTHFQEIIHGNTPNFLKTTLSWISKIPIHIGDPNRGDVVVIRPHVSDKQEFFIKRIIGMPGETIKFTDGQVYIKPVGKEDFTLLQESYLDNTNSGSTLIPSDIDQNEFVIPEHAYWVMGDNRMNSTDSRQCFQGKCNTDKSTHFIDRKDIVGRAWVSFGHFNIFKEKERQHYALELEDSDKRFTWEVKPRFFNNPNSATYPEITK